VESGNAHQREGRGRKNGTSSMMKNVCHVFYAVFIFFFKLKVYQ